MASLIPARRLYLPIGIDLGGPEPFRRQPRTKCAGAGAEPQTYGDHVRARRLELGMYRREAGDLVGVDKATVYGWESSRYGPSLRQIPRLVEFLGYSLD